MAQKLGVLGLGTMGGAIVPRLLGAGYTVLAYDPDAAALARASAAGVTAAQGPGEVAAGCEVVLCCVTNQDLLCQVLTAPGGVFARAPAGTVVVDLGTTEPERCRSLDAQARAKGLEFLDAPLSGGAPWASEGRLTVMVGGSAAAYTQVLPVLQSFGRSIFHMGPVGTGQSVKLCHQLAFMGLLFGLSEAVVLGERAGISGNQVLEVLGACVSPRHTLDFMVPKLARRPLPDNPGGIEIFRKDLKSVVETAGVLGGLELPLARTLLGFFDQAIAAGHGAHDPFDMAALIELGLLRVTGESGVGPAHGATPGTRPGF